MDKSLGGRGEQGAEGRRARGRRERIFSIDPQKVAKLMGDDEVPIGFGDSVDLFTKRLDFVQGVFRFRLQPHDHSFESLDAFFLTSISIFTPRRLRRPTEH